GGAPVDVPHGVTHAVLRELLEICALAALLIGLDADFLQPMVASEPRIPRNLRKVGVNTPTFQRSKAFEQIAKAPTRSNADVSRLEPRFATACRCHQIGELDPGAF